MKFLSTTRTKRSTAIVMLLVWLFALASGVANACLLATPQSHSNVASAAVPATSHATAELVGHDSDTWKESCLKACDDGARTLPNAKAGVDQTDPSSAPLVATLWAASTPIASVPRRLDDRQLHTVGPPLRIRFSRLAL
jgi:hypothetical protein